MANPVHFAALMVGLAGSAGATVQTIGLSGQEPILARIAMLLNERPRAGFRGLQFENSLGCVYARRQAPDARVVWHLHEATRAPGCPDMIFGD
jgi:hypothetical protein